MMMAAMITIMIFHYCEPMNHKWYRLVMIRLIDKLHELKNIHFRSLMQLPEMDL